MLLVQAARTYPDPTGRSALLHRVRGSVLIVSEYPPGVGSLASPVPVPDQGPTPILELS
jgi:hypothetical protein